MALNQIELSEALSSISQDGSSQACGWSQEIHTIFELDSIVIEDLGAFRFPLRIGKLTSIINKYKESGDLAGKVQRRSCKVTAENIQALQENPSKESLSKLIDQIFKQKFGPGIENVRVYIDAQMECLIICQPLEKVKIPPKAHPGVFGTILLQAPVGVEGFVSANIQIHENRKKEILSYKQKPPFYMTIVSGNQYAKSTLTVEPISKEPAVFLVYNLVWLNSDVMVKYPSPHKAFSFLDKLQKVNRALSGWENITLDLVFQDPVLSTGDCVLPSKNSVSDPQKTVAVCIPTRHGYNYDTFQMGILETEDGDMLSLLKAVCHVDVSIVILAIEHPIKTGDGNRNLAGGIAMKEEAKNVEEKVFSVHRWIQGDWMFPILHEKFSCLRFDRHLVGDISCVFEKESLRTQEETPVKRAKLDEHSSRNLTYHPAIIIRPRKLAIFDCWTHCPILTVQRLTQRVTLAYECSFENERQVMLQEVNFIVDSVVEDECKLSDCRRTAILHQLLHLCTRLKAVDEGLKILELIPQRQCDCRETHRGSSFKGFFWEENLTIEDIVVRLVSHAGWKKCSTLVCSMYSRREVSDFFPLHQLSYSLRHDLGCFEGAIALAKECIRILAKQEDYELLNHVESDSFESPLDYYLDLTLSKSSNIKMERKEIYSLLGQVVTSVSSYVLYVMIRYYFNRVAIEFEEKLTDLKQTIASLIGQVERYDNDCAIFFVICFVYRTRDSELADLAWSKLLSCENDKQMSDFERMLSNEQKYSKLDGIQYLYKAISLSPSAKEHFYRYIDGRLKKTDEYEDRYLYDLESCFYHLTMAEKEPNFLDEQRFKSFLSVFNEMDAETLMEAVDESIIYDDTSTQTRHPTSKTIVSALFDSLSKRDLATMLNEETKYFGATMYCYIRRADDAAKLELIQKLKETFVLANHDESDPVDAKTDTLLLKTWLTVLQESKSKRSIIAYQTLQFFYIFCEIMDISFHSVKVVTLRDFGCISAQLTFEFLERFLIALYERERIGTSECLKRRTQWRTSQSLCDLLTVEPEMAKEIFNLKPERIFKLMCCIFWLGSETANKRFVGLVRKMPFATTRYCLSLFIASSDELKMCAISSYHAFLAFLGITRDCIKHSLSDVGCASSWSNATTVDNREINEFLLSENRSKTFGPFGTLDEANRFIHSAIKNFFGIDCAIKKIGNSYNCEFTKVYPALLDPVFSGVDSSLCKILTNCSCFSPFEYTCSICVNPVLKTPAQ